MTQTSSPPQAPTGRIRRVLATTYGGLPRAFWVQWVGVLVNRLGTFVEPFLALYLSTARGLTIAQTGMVMVVYGAGSLAGPLLGGFLADRFDRRVALSGSLVASAAALLGLGAASTPVTIAVAAFLVGLTADLYRPASGALVADIVPLALRPRAYGLLFWAINLGFSIAAVSGGWIAGHGFGLLFVINAVTCLTFGALIFFLVKPGVAAKKKDDEPSVGYLTALRDPLLVTLVGLTMVYSTMYMQAYVTLPLTMHASGLTAAQYGSAVAVNGVVIVLLQPFASRWLERFRPTTVMAFSGLLVGTGLGLTSFAHSHWAYAGTVAVWTLGEIGMAGFGQALIADLAPPAARGRYQALFTLGFSSSMILAPAAGTALLTTVGPAGPWVGCLAGGLVLLLGYLAVTGPVQRRRQAANGRTVTTSA
ncbi:MDR family MFS transporter [Fodinicola acaciae]|uniref:MDR family MFS transporter n=1 Tax=Fodinicola acaciae TaxID=2681555 RepID=UPI0013D0F155|nr:MFS transporter [Fodinicola acaciae]